MGLNGAIEAVWAHLRGVSVAPYNASMPLRILALETSGSSGSVAAIDGEHLLGETALDPAKRSGQTLAPAIRDLLTYVGWAIRNVQLLAVTSGPGSFTGLRVGVTTAKTLAYAIGADVLGVNTLAAIAEQSPLDASPVWAVVDAQRGELYAARFERREGRVIEVAATEIVPADRWLTNLGHGDSVIGPGLERWVSAIPNGVRTIERDLWTPMARTVGQLAAQDHAAGRRDDLWQLAPRYFRKSAAEERVAGGG